MNKAALIACLAVAMMQSPVAQEQPVFRISPRSNGPDLKQKPQPQKFKRWKGAQKKRGHK
jgi:hypothetical protein